MKAKKQTSISYNFLKWLLFLMLVAFIATTVFLWMFQTRLANNNADNLLRLNITDVKADIKDATNDHMLEIVRNISAELDDIDADTASDPLKCTLFHFYPLIPPVGERETCERREK